MKVVGRLVTKKKVEHSKHFWGEVKEIEAVALSILEINPQQDCLCFSDKGLVDMDHRDIAMINEYGVGVRVP